MDGDLGGDLWMSRGICVGFGGFWVVAMDLQQGRLVGCGRGSLLGRQVRRVAIFVVRVCWIHIPLGHCRFRCRQASSRVHSAASDDDHRGEVLQPAHQFKSLWLASVFHVNFGPLFFLSAVVGFCFSQFI